MSIPMEVEIMEMALLWSHRPSPALACGAFLRTTMVARDVDVVLILVMWFAVTTMKVP